MYQSREDTVSPCFAVGDYLLGVWKYMEAFVEFATGDFDGSTLRRYLAVVCAIYGSLILSCVALFPAPGFSIMIHSYSTLGSWNESNNPQWWWLFSTAMTMWGIAMIPVVFYNYRRMAVISGWAAAIGSFLMLLGGIGVSLVGIFPDAHGTIGAYEIREIHKYVAIFGAGFYILSNIWFGVMLLIDALRNRFDGDFNYKWFIPPYVAWGSVFVVGVHFMLEWERVYPQVKAAAIAAGQPVPGHYGGALNTRYSFPLWENLVIYSLIIFIVWFALALPKEVPAGER